MQYSAWSSKQCYHVTARSPESLDAMSSLSRRLCPECTFWPLVLMSFLWTRLSPSFSQWILSGTQKTEFLPSVAYTWEGWANHCSVHRVKCSNKPTLPLNSVPTGSGAAWGQVPNAARSGSKAGFVTSLFYRISCLLATISKLSHFPYFRPWISIISNALVFTQS